MKDAARFRLAGLDDADAIGALTRAAYAKWVAVAGREPLPMRIDYADAVTRHRFDLLDIAEALAGLIETVPQEGRLLIVNVAVHPDFQKRGLGRMLLARAEDVAVKAGLAGMRLYTNRLFVENIRLYQRLGYAIEREAALNGGVAVHMAKRLAGAAAQQH